MEGTNQTPITDLDVDVLDIPSPTQLSQYVATSKRKNPYKMISIVWDHFTKIPKPDGGKPDRAKRNYCNREFGCDSTQGTSTLKRHLEKCTRYPYGNKEKQQVLSFSVSSEQGGTTVSTWKFDQELCRRELARMLVVEELPFKFVEREGFRNFCRVLQPRFNFNSRTTLKKDCLELYKKEKKKINEALKKSDQRVCLTTDMWTSIQNLGYMCITIHYIDTEWKLHKRIISFCSVPSPHTGAIANELEVCLLGWGLEKICTVTVDNCSSNDVAIRNLQKRLKKKNSLLLDGEFLHMRCCAHILNLIVRDGIEEVKTSVASIRNATRHVKSSPSRLQQFKLCANQEKISCTKTVCLDVCTRWNSTFLMLQSALEFQKAFERLADLDCNFQFSLKDGPPTDEDWDRAKVLCRFLERFYISTKKFISLRMSIFMRFMLLKSF
ncbi:zinc finger BED domain-containing protein RICESLEEPER 2-like [Tasmannia lanceolata]|uniref:zinc finger BED domain-containing protein RICESLEEPER 2-like n=1 Tax=Tasmannia lanceolata TaxID=3420 RepID=UPI004063E4A3